MNFAVVKVNEMSGTKVRPDKNGLTPVILTTIGGSIPDKRVLSGTFAQREQLFDGGVYQVGWEELDEDPTYGRQFRFTNLGELKGSELAKTCKECGPAVVFKTELVEETNA